MTETHSSRRKTSTASSATNSQKVESRRVYCFLEFLSGLLDLLL